MDGEYIESECSQSENKRPYFLMDEEDLDEARLDAEEHHTNRPQTMDCAHGPCCNIFIYGLV